MLSIYLLVRANVCEIFEKNRENAAFDFKLRNHEEEKSLILLYLPA